MTWPTLPVDPTDLDADTDSPLLARQDILDAVVKLNQMIAHVSLYAATLLPAADAAAFRSLLELPAILVDVSADVNLVTIPFVFDGGGAALTTGIKGDLRIKFAFTIQSVTLLADQTGSIVIDIWKDSYANYPPTAGDSITAAAKPTISAAIKAENTTLTGWSPNLASGDCIRFNIDSVSAITRCTLLLHGTKVPG